MKKIEIYTDGSSLGNPGPGGWGSVFVENDTKSSKRGSSDASTEAFRKIIKELGGFDKNTTNNRMELMAVIETLKYLSARKVLAEKECNVTIFADSNYVLLGITTWIHNWEKNGWRNASKKEVMNQDLWKELISLIRNYDNKINWQKVKGHSGHIYNDKADEIATTFAEHKTFELIG